MVRGDRIRGALLRTALGYAVALWAMATIVFLLPRLMPGDPLATLVDPDDSIVLSPDDRARVAAYYGLDRPLVEQYGRHLSGLLRGEAGWSISRKAPVAEVVRSHLPWTLALVVPALALSSLAGFIGGVTAAWRRGRWADRMLTVTVSALRAVPDYALAFALLLAGGVAAGWFPLGGARTPFTQNRPLWAQLPDIAHHAALPSLAIALSLIGGKFLLARSAMVSVLGQEYVLLARAKGLSERRVKYRHAARNAWLPFLAQLGVQAGFAVGGAVFVETVFSYPGMGSLILAAVDARDYPLLEATFLTLGVVVLAANLLADLAARRHDPRVTAR